mgnify:CR=1 FL=1
MTKKRNKNLTTTKTKTSCLFTPLPWYLINLVTGPFSSVVLNKVKSHNVFDKKAAKWINNKKLSKGRLHLLKSHNLFDFCLKIEWILSHTTCHNFINFSVYVCIYVCVWLYIYSLRERKRERKRERERESILSVSVAS